MEEAKKEIARYGKATAKPGQGAALGELLLQAADRNRALGGCLQYDVYRSVFDPDVIWVTELWTDQAAVDRSLNDEVNRGLIERGRDLIADMEMVELVPLGGIGDRLRRLADAGGPALPPATGGSGHTKVNLSAVEDSAPAHGFGEFHEARFLGGPLEAAQTGFAHFRLKPGKRQPFGHSHGDVEEVYYAISGSGRIKLEDEALELAAGDAIRIAPGVMHAVEAGPDGLEFVAFGPKGDWEAGGGEMTPGWWG